MRPQKLACPLKRNHFKRKMVFQSSFFRVFSGGSPTLRQFFFVTYIATIAFGLIRVITAVFLRDTLDAAAMDAEEQVGDFVGLHLEYLNTETTGSLNRKFEFFGGRRNMSNFLCRSMLNQKLYFFRYCFFNSHPLSFAGGSYIRF